MIAGLIRDINIEINLNWQEKKHGLVFANSVDLPGTNGKKIVLPFAWGTEDCKNDNAVSPDQKYRCVSWYEASGIIDTDANRMERGFLHITEARIVCWLNMKKISSNEYIGDQCIRTMEAAINDLKFSNTEYDVISCKPKRILIGDRAILDKYQFDQRVRMTIYPYMIFSIDFNIAFTLKCQDITIEPIC